VVIASLSVRSCYDLAVMLVEHILEYEPAVMMGITASSK
jgi:hypothetical protein